MAKYTEEGAGMKNSFISNIKKFFSSISVRKKIFLAFYIQIIIPLLIMQYMYYQRSAEIIKQKSIDYSQDLLKIVEYRIESLVDNISMQSQIMLSVKRIYDALKRSNSTDYLTSVEDIKTVNNVKNMLRDTTLSIDGVQSICLVSNERKFYSYNMNSGRINIEQAIPYDKVLKKARKAIGKPTWYVDEEKGKVKNIFLVRTINDPSTFEEVGIMAFAIDKNAIASTYKDFCTDSMKNVLIVSEDQKVISSSDYNITSDLSINKIANDKGYYIDKDLDMLISYVSVNNTNWKALSYIPLKELYKEINDLKKWHSILFMITIIVSTIFSLLISLDILNPINEITCAMKEFEDGLDYKEIRTNRSDELGYMSMTFNNMAKRINHLVKCIYEEQITRKEAEIKALQAQINPHFLYNTLETINWIAQLNGVSEISDTVLALSSLIEANMGRDNKLISLEDELKYIEDYIFIIKKRYDERLEVVKDVDETILNIKIPRLLIQPLVENAVSHGLEKSREKVVVNLIAHRAQDDIVIEVMDNGIGIKEEELDILNLQFKKNSGDYIQKRNRRSIGLQNVNRRIKLFYGDNYGLNIESKYMKYTKMYFMIPYSQDTGEGDNHV